ncbi:MAG TPA: TonB-dependent receptor, partial [Rhizomicrobium sp.]
MLKTNLNSSNLRSVLLLGAASAAAIGWAGSAAAQQTGTNSSGVETVVVTGSRIPQTGVYSASPVTAVGQQELKFEGTTDVTTLINNLPEAFVDQNQGVANGASGTANVDLRGLGSKRTLVLVNGTRLMPGDVADPVADLNDIPAALVDHVEVLTGGASAVYGSDALAGVVNFMMRKDFEGIEVDGTYSIAENDNDTSRWRNLTQNDINQGAYGFAQSKSGVWDGQTDDATLIMGTNTANDKGNVTAYIGYRNSQPVLESSRDYSECTIGSLNTVTGSTSTGGPYTTSTCNGSSNYDRFLSLDNIYGGAPSADYFVNGKAPNGNFVPYTGAANQHFNYGALNYLQRPDTRYTGGFFAHYQENKELDVYSSFMFADDHTVAQIAQSGFFLASGQGPSGSVYTNCSNPYMTSLENYDLCGQLPGDGQNTVTLANGQKFTYWNGASNGLFNPLGAAGQANLYIGRRDLEGPDRQDDLRHTSYRINLGARGDLGDGWSYDVYAQYGLTLLTENYTGEFSKTRTQNAIEVDPVTGQCYAAEQQNGLPPTAPNCVPINIFAGIGGVSKQALNYVLASGFQEGWTQEQIVSGNITGDLGEWGIQSPWAKSPVGVSFGAEYRDEQTKLQTDQEFTTNDLYGQGAATLSVPQSGFNVSEGFTEVKVPLVQGLPWIEDLSLNGGYRYSSYNTAGSTNTYKYGAEWQPIDDFRLRASMQRAVRAPNVLELFAPANVILFSGQDPCNGATGIVYNNCVHNKYAPVPPGTIASGLTYCPATQCDEQVGGNSALKPEVSDTRTAGIVFTPTFLDGFTATVDWFDIKVDNYINTLPPQETLNECYGASATAASMAYFCPFVHRNGA